MLDDAEKQDLRDVMVDSLIQLTRAGMNIAVLVSDSTSTSKITPFTKQFPDRLINVGIAEQSLVGTAAGMSLGGYVAVTANAAPFLVNRANEQVKNDVCYSNTNVKLMGLNAGVCYGALASTHHAIDDVSIMRGFGNILIFAPSDGIEAKQIFAYALNYVGPVYVRMDSAKLPNIHDEKNQKVRSAFKLCPRQSLFLESDVYLGENLDILKCHYERSAQLINCELNQLKEVLLNNGEVFTNRTFDRD